MVASRSAAPEGANGTGPLIAGWIAYTLSEEIAEEQPKEIHPKMCQMLG